MTPQQLKNSILQLAIQGKLVEQVSSEGTAEELYAQIQEEKKRLIAEKKIKKEKPLAAITDEEIPFDIPESWKWVYLNDIVSKDIKRGKSPTYADKGKVLVFAQKCNTKAGEIALSLAKCLDDEKIVKYPESEYMQFGDCIINSTGGGTMGRVGFYDVCEPVKIVPDSHVTIVRAKDVNSEYLYYFIKTYQSFLERQGEGSTNQTELKPDVIKSLLIALPPYAEQERIVNKIEQLLPLVDRYGEAWTKLEAFNQKFPEDMKKSILQQAVQGKLVEQRIEDGTADIILQNIANERKRLISEGVCKKEKKYPSISELEKYFDIPENWEWVRLASIVYNRGQKTPVNKFSYIDIGSIDNMHQKLSNTDNIIEAEKAPSRARKIVSIGDILYSTVRPYLHNMCIVDRQFSEEPIASTGFAVMSCFEGVYNKYLFYYLLSPFFDRYANSVDNAKGVAYPAINDDRLYKAVVPLPPFEEQKRIVKKIEELLPLCDSLIK